MKNYQGIIIEESLENKDVLKDVKIVSTKVEKVTAKHQTPWLKQWTLHTVEITEQKAEKIADVISRNLETKHTAWYADFKHDNFHYIIFPEKVFKVNRRNDNEYEEAKQHGISLGIPDYQLDFSPEVNR